ncbi:MAG: ABC transporter substrate-binding protein [Oceanospirillaceae bacterium]
MEKTSLIYIKYCAFSLFIGLTTPVFSASIIEKVMQREALNVCIWPGYYAISYRPPRTSVLNGIDVDMARLFAKWLSVKLNFVDSSFAKLQQNITNGKCDIAMHGVAIRESRKAYMNFSAPHLRSSIYGISMQSNQQIRTWDDIDQEGVIAVVQKKTFMEPVMRATLKHAQLLVVDSFKAREQAVQSGRADVFMTDFPYGKRMTSLTKWARLLSPKQPFASTEYAYAVPKGDLRWLAKVNSFLREKKADGTLLALAEKYQLTPIVVTN